MIVLKYKLREGMMKMDYKIFDALVEQGELTIKGSDKYDRNRGITLDRTL